MCFLCPPRHVSCRRCPLIGPQVHVLTRGASQGTYKFSSASARQFSHKRVAMAAPITLGTDVDPALMADAVNSTLNVVVASCAPRGQPTAALAPPHGESMRLCSSHRARSRAQMAGLFANDTSGCGRPCSTELALGGIRLPRSGSAAHVCTRCPAAACRRARRELVSH